MVDERPAQAPALEDPEGFEALSDDLVLRACLRAPFVTHGTLAAVCSRFKSLLRSDAFGKLRLEYGLVEHGVPRRARPLAVRARAANIAARGESG